MFEKNLHIDLLLDFYGDILDDRTRDMLTQYYEDDLSLSEIAMNFQMTRQGVRRVIKRGETVLTNLENALGLAERFKSLKKSVTNIKEYAASMTDSSDNATAKAAAMICAEADAMAEIL